MAARLPVLFEDIAIAATRIRGGVVRSPVTHSYWLSQLCGCDVFLKHCVVLATLVPLFLCTGQLVLYNGLGVDEHGHYLGEPAAHVLEFSFDGLAAAINFWFCLDSRALAEELTRQIMIAPNELVVVIDPESSTSVHAADEIDHHRNPFMHSPHNRPGAPRPYHSSSNGSSHAPQHQHAHVHDHHVAHDHIHGHADGCDDHDCCAHHHAPPHGKPPPPSLSKEAASALTELLLPPDVARQHSHSRSGSTSGGPPRAV